MKKARAVLAGIILFLPVVCLINGQVTSRLDQSGGSIRADNVNLNGSNTFWLQLTSVTNNTASLVIYVPGTATNNIYNLLFTTNIESPSTWSQLMRCAPGQTNLVVTNLPPDQGFFTLGSPIRPGFDQQSLAANDDGSTANPVPLGLSVNFLSNTESAVFVNNNGNVTFEKSLSMYSPVIVSQAGAKIIAPFWADVDTRSPSPGVAQYGTNVVHGHNAFGVDWVNVGYYSTHADKLLSCQLVIIDRSDIAPGDFDMEFNYCKVQWEAGDASGGSGGYWQGPSGGPARAGFSDGFTDYELPGSGLSGALLDTNTMTGLINNSLNSHLPGRYLFFFRDGQPLP